MTQTDRLSTPIAHGAPGARTTEDHVVSLPEPTPWPFVLALGVCLLVASLVLTAYVGALGFALAVAGTIGWFKDIFPHERHENVPVSTAVVAIKPSNERVARIQVDETHRAQLPLQTFPIVSGIKGGIAGGIAMIIPAEIYGLIRYHSLWYVVNLLGGAGVGAWRDPTPQELSHFHWPAFLIANAIQGVTTLLVGLLYGAMLPIWPRRPVLLGGIVAPVLWTGLLRSVLGIVNPYFSTHIDWFSFALSQVFFGVVAGYVVSRTGQLRRLRQVPLSVRLGVETPGLHPGAHGKEPTR